MEKLTKYEKFTILFLAILIFVGSLIFLFTKMNTSTDTITIKKNQENIISNNEAKEENYVVVHITGAVAKPDVYKVKENSRVIDVVRFAQPLPYADINSLNLASKVFDGQKIIVPEKNILTPSIQKTTSPDNKKLVNINTADERELDSLPGIGPATAKKIVDYRATKGYFTSIDDIKNIPGIGEKKFEQFKDLITVN